MNIRILTPKLRERLKSPLGILICGQPDETAEKLKKMIKEEKPEKIISVGDFVSKNLIKHGIQPQVSIIDRKIMREPAAEIAFPSSYQTLNIRNPPGTLSDEAFFVIKKAIESEGKTKIVVDGEEDLLTLVAVEKAPENSFVIYGQPNEGIVVVKVTEQKRVEVKQIIGKMKLISKT